LHQNKVPGRIKSILLGEVIDRAGVRRDIQLKEAGPTPYSRRGDGRAALGPVRREYIVSEAIGGARDSDDWGAGAVTTGEPVWRKTALPGAVLTRVASSHVRVGTFRFSQRVAMWMRSGASLITSSRGITQGRKAPRTLSPFLTR
jgi:uncharacterized protein YdiU (UPF0061 family)